MTQTVEQMSDEDLLEARNDVSVGARKSGHGILSAKIIDGPNAGKTIGEAMALEMIERELLRRSIALSPTQQKG